MESSTFLFRLTFLLFLSFGACARNRRKVMGGNKEKIEKRFHGKGKEKGRRYKERVLEGYYIFIILLSPFPFPLHAGPKEKVLIPKGARDRI